MAQATEVSVDLNHALGLCMTCGQSLCGAEGFLQDVRNQEKHSTNSNAWKREPVIFVP
jgi:uncharacterized UBP type Zn finger protein